MSIGSFPGRAITLTALLAAMATHLTGDLTAQHLPDDRFIPHVNPLTADVRLPPPARPGPRADSQLQALEFGEVTRPVVRIGYIIPSNRTAQSQAVANLQRMVRIWQEWLADQMESYGFGRKSFLFETEEDGVTPRVHIVPVTLTDADIRSDIWGQTLTAAGDAGVPVWTPGQVWLLIPEAHVQNPDGSISGGVFLGASFGSNDDPGVAMIGSDALARFGPTFLEDERAYAGEIIPEIGPYPLVQDVSFPWFEGTTFSSISSAVQGCVLHELGHAWGLAHDFRDDSNYLGDLMGNGCRGLRGNLFPEDYPDEYIRLSYDAALALNSNPYFNANVPIGLRIEPTLAIHTSGLTQPVNGKLRIEFTADDPDGLVAAILIRQGDVIGEIALDGPFFMGEFQTPFYTPGESAEFAITVIDTYGNRRTVTSSITPQTGGNRAPQPQVRVVPQIARVVDVVQLDASGSSDPDHNADSLTVEWDLNGDGIFDTAPTTAKAYDWVPSGSGIWTIRARVTDPAGSSSLSTPIPVLITEDTVEISGVVLYYGNGLPVSGVTVRLSGDDAQTGVTGPDGAFSFLVPSRGDYTVAPEPSQDGLPALGISTVDIALIRRHLLGIATFHSPYEFLAADVNLSGSVTTADIGLLRRRILGFTDGFPEDSSRFVPSDFVSANESQWRAPADRIYMGLNFSMSGQDFVAILLGDVNGSWVP